MKEKSCTFFGHRDCPQSVRSSLWVQIESLIVNEGVTRFYVGHQGAFDAQVCFVLRELQKKYPYIVWEVVLAYRPTENEEGAIFPEEVARSVPRYAIEVRNKWMLERSTYVIAFVTRSWGGAAKFVALAKRQGKRVIVLAQ